MSAIIDGASERSGLSHGLRQLQGQLRANARLRWGLFFICITLWVWSLLLLQDQAQIWRAEADEALAEVQRLKPVQSAKEWPQRADDASKHLEAARAMMWPAASQGLAEAALQDTLRTWSEKAGLPIRELSVSSTSGGDPALAVEGLPLRARLVVDFNRIGMMGLLSELGRSPKVMLVESLRLRPVMQPGRAELEVRVLYRSEERKP
ncbi:hypothetical protein OOZ63_25145 [Paucibacter sp. PLA-PC-4]|uniref:hypothetical protein n=1 Tax=Paucibacter sp. PLA-PC-4 TaxID=2993655 RepID=UPI00224B0EC1|nr:hypothetical protein [Paucibacter sp. PLA-PC-4]MCX2865119.1 hypothetical protein [Paucibacter sp. PLA-PC-4]